MPLSNKNEILKHYFGHDRFRKGQEEIADALLAGRDAVCVMPTGAGKSVCYQVPAMLLPGYSIASPTSNGDTAIGVGHWAKTFCAAGISFATLYSW